MVHRKGALLPSASVALPPPAVLAKQLGELLLAFPASAIGGVQWQTLVRKYEERHRARLDVVACGHSTALAAASALLWDVACIIDKEDVDNPVVGIEADAALEPRPGLLGCWPSLYRSLCDIVLNNGTSQLVENSGNSVPVSGLLLSQLKPLLERYWHANFEESGCGYLNEEGTFIRLKKMKHLVLAVIRWREQRVAVRATEGTSKFSSVDQAIEMRLELTASKKHNDLVLYCFTDKAEADLGGRPAQQAAAILDPLALFVDPTPASSSQSEPSSEVEPASPCRNSVQMQLSELAQLRAENAALRSRNDELALCQAAEKVTEWAPVPAASSRLPLCLPLMGTPVLGTPALGTPVREPSTPRLEHEIFDDPFEPPPEADKWRSHPPLWRGISGISGLSASTSSGSNSVSAAASDAGISTCGTPMSSTLGANFKASLDMYSNAASGTASGALTPALPPQGGTISAHLGQACSFMPVWFQVIPSGIVQSLRSNFEPGQQL